MDPSENATVYLIHFERPFHHAQHYLGYTVNLAQRLEYHRKGTGAKLLRAVTQHGIPWEVVRTWSGNQTLERALKNRKKSRELCPVCLKQRWSTRFSLKPLPHVVVTPLWEVEP